MKRSISAILAVLSLCACSTSLPETFSDACAAELFPDYSYVTIPDNIAPLNFNVTEDCEACMVEIGGKIIKARHGLVSFNRGWWKRTIAKTDSLSLTVYSRKGREWVRHEPFTIRISHDPIDSYLSFRLIPPGYQGWNELGLYQRCLETFRETPILENRLTDGNCLNCHTLNNRDPETFLFHSRASFGGTYMLMNGESKVVNTKTDSTAATRYAYWHPNGRFIAYSVNDTQQNFFASNPDRIEVYDNSSDVVIYDVEKGAIFWSAQIRSKDSFETYPVFTPDGKNLIFCSAKAVTGLPESFREVKYSLCMIAFDPLTGSLGEKVDTLFSAPRTGLSVAFPKVSPDGKHVVFVVQDHGSFAIWHKDSDLWSIELPSGEAKPMAELNSSDGESWHTWSDNSCWLAFGSRRDDGLFTKVYISHVDENGNASKPFLMPQKDPLRFYHDCMNSYNLPEFMTGPVAVRQKAIARTLKRTSPEATILRNECQ